MPGKPHTESSPVQKGNGRLILVIGGGASGKSQTALDLAGTASPKVFVATGQALDAEMGARIARHRNSRPPEWVTAEVPVDLMTWLQREGGHYRTIVLDCLTLWLNNLQGKGRRTSAPAAPISPLLAALRGTKARVVVVSNELGLGVVPVAASARSFRDLAGRVNQRVAAEADEVYLVVAGMPLRLK